MIRFCLIAAIGFITIGCVSSPSVRVTFGDLSCGGLLVSSSAVMTSAHCVQAQKDKLVDEVTCEGQKACVTGWYVHPEYKDEAEHDLAIGFLNHPLGCYSTPNVDWVDVGDDILFHGILGKVDENDGESLVLDIDPQKFCLGDSGRPVFDAYGNAVGIVSRWWGGMRGCTYIARATTIAANRSWIEKVLGSGNQGSK